jgi:hypothetical protein
MAGAFAEHKVLLKQKQAELDAQARFLAGEQQYCMHQHKHWQQQQQALCLNVSSCGNMKNG